MSDTRRAVLVNEADLRTYARVHVADNRTLRDAYDAAGEQPRKRVCATHNYRDAWADEEGFWFCIKGYGEYGRGCRVVSALVVVLDEETET